MLSPITRRLICGLCFCLLSLPLEAAPAAPPASPAPSAKPPAPPALWNVAKQGAFVTCLAHDGRNLWAGTEDNGVWRYSLASRQWTQFTSKSGLGDDDIYALAVDWKHRVWAGTLNHGVAVFNGKTWKTYDQITGPLGEHVTALAVGPNDGDVWMASNAGLARYSLNHDTWTYYTRADGLPSDQADALAFGKDGTLYVGTACDGLAIGSPKDGYKTWRVVRGPDIPPHSPTGDGLPSGEINAVLVAGSGAVFVGTPDGLAVSRDAGQTWRFLRGEDWVAKTQGTPGEPPPFDTDPGGPRLREDWVTCLAEETAGQIVVGHRDTGGEVIDAATGARVEAALPDADHLTALLPLSGALLAATYGKGVVVFGALAPLPGVESAEAAAFPVPAAPPTDAELTAWTAQVTAMTKAMPTGGAAALGQDWTTQGDWLGRYGRQYARLCAAQAPWGDHAPMAAAGYAATPALGSHRTLHDALRSWISVVQTDNPKALYDPIIGYRRQAEWDDHGETYDRAKTGPDVWVRLTVPEGVHRVSLYFVNKDGHAGDNSDRDFRVEIYADTATLTDAEAGPPLAQARVKDFWGGVYQSFLVRGPGHYEARIARRYSKNAIVSGVFVDKMTRTMAPFEDMGTVWLGDVRDDPPQTPDPPADAPATERAAQALWSALDGAWGKADALPVEAAERLLAYRAALAGRASPERLEAWRWRLPLWTPGDRLQSERTAAAAYKSLVELNPALKDAKR